MSDASANDEFATASMLPAALRPVQQNIERAFGGVIDALGGGPVRAMLTAVSALAISEFQKMSAATQLGLVVVTVAPRAAFEMSNAVAESIRKRAAERAAPAPLQLLRSGANAAERVLHETMQSERGLIAVARLVRASTASRRRINDAIAIASGAVNIPTRAEVDEAYRLIQELRRELRKRQQPTAVARKTARNTARKTPRKAAQKKPG